MECPVCMEEFDAAGRRPKCLPCGHTVCSHCLGGLRERRCPECRRDFVCAASALPDNFAILGLVDKKPSTSSSIHLGSIELLKATALQFWCRDCDRAAEESCADCGHVLCSLRKVRSERAAPQLQRLGDADSNASKVVRTLGGAKDAVEDLLQYWRARKRQVQQADRELRAAVDEGGDLEAGQPEGLQQLQDAASLLEGMECGLRHKGGKEWWGDLGAAGRSLLDALVLHLHRHGRIHKDAFQQQPAVVAPTPALDPIQELDLDSLSLTAPGFAEEEKAATLARVRQHGVRRMTNLYCQDDPAWALAVLRSAAPTLEELHVLNPREEHLLAAHAMPGLRQMEVWGDRALDAQPPLLPALPRGGLKRLRVDGLPRRTLSSLLQAHSASLEELWLRVGTPGVWRWPEGCDDLDALLGQCGLRVSRVVLGREYVTHSSACAAQVSAVRRVLPAATVQCSECDGVAKEDF